VTVHISGCQDTSAGGMKVARLRSVKGVRMYTEDGAAGGPKYTITPHLLPLLSSEYLCFMFIYFYLFLFNLELSCFK